MWKRFLRLVKKDTEQFWEMIDVQDEYESSSRLEHNEVEFFIHTISLN